MKTTTEIASSKKKTLQLSLMLVAVAILSLFPLFSLICYPAPYNTQSCVPSFPDRNGWYGGDGAYSILLDHGRTLWLFGDSFVSVSEGKQSRVGMDVIPGTTLAISTCSREGQFSIRYFLKKNENRLISYFGDSKWMWPQDPFKVKDILYIPLVVVEPAPEVAGPFKFRITGYKIAMIRNYHHPNPLDWSVEYLDWSAAVPAGIAALATTSVVHGRYVYFYPLCVLAEKAGNVVGNILVRIPANLLQKPARAMEYYSKEEIWSKGLDLAKAKIVLNAGASELSVRYHEDRKRWIAVYLSLQNKGDHLLYRDAKRLEGPWSSPKILLPSIPELNPTDPKYHKDNFCYAGKEHLQFSKKGKVVTTYVCNSLDDVDKKINFIRNNLFLYRPIVNEVPY
jgi:hypothetical protein